MDTAMRIKCASCPIHLRRWIGSRFKLDFIIIHDSCKVKVMLTMRSLACMLAWLVITCGMFCIAIFCSALAATLGKNKACFLMAKKCGTAW